MNVVLEWKFLVTFHGFPLCFKLVKLAISPYEVLEVPILGPKDWNSWLPSKSPTDFHPAFHMAVAFIPVIALPAALIEGGSLYLILDAREVVIDLVNHLCSGEILILLFFWEFASKNCNGRPPNECQSKPHNRYHYLCLPSPEEYLKTVTGNIVQRPNSWELTNQSANDLLFGKPFWTTPSTTGLIL